MRSSFTTLLVSVSLLLLAADVHSLRVLPADQTFLAKRSLVEERAPTADAGAKLSAIHKRVTKHLRPDTVTRRDQVPLPNKNKVAAMANAGGSPQPVRGAYGYKYIHPSNEAIDRQNPDYVHPSKTDSGNVPNMKWAFSLSHTRLLKGGWVREQTVTDLPIAKQISAAELALAPYAFRELHWHRLAEWAYVFNGTVRLTGVDRDGGMYIDDVGPGDLWAFPSGVPHTLQAGPEGASFLLVFDDGDFDAVGTTFQVDDWIRHTPVDVLAQNFGWDVDVFKHDIPTPDPYMLPGTKESWTSLEEAREAIGDAPATDTPFGFKMSEVKPTKAAAGWYKIIDYTTFNASQTLASAFVHVEPGALRELHWHGNGAVEWGYIVSGRARATVFVGNAMARSFDLQTGDTWFFPTGTAHYIQNLDASQPLEFIEVLRGANTGDRVRFNDFSLTQWLALNPPSYVAQQLNVSVDLVKQLKKQKQVVVDRAPKGV